MLLSSFLLSCVECNIVTKYFVKILLWLTIELCGLHTELIFITNKNALDQTKLCQL